jgi:hypothetical protein
MVHHRGKGSSIRLQHIPLLLEAAAGAAATTASADLPAAEVAIIASSRDVAGNAAMHKELEGMTVGGDAVPAISTGVKMWLHLTNFCTDGMH